MIIIYAGGEIRLQGFFDGGRMGNAQGRIGKIKTESDAFLRGKRQKLVVDLIDDVG